MLGIEKQRKWKLFSVLVSFLRYLKTVLEATKVCLLINAHLICCAR